MSSDFDISPSPETVAKLLPIVLKFHEGHLTRDEAERDLWAIGLAENAVKFCLSWAPLLLGTTDRLIGDMRK